MNVSMPPLIFYGLGFILVVFGAMRAWALGYRRREEPVPGDEELPDEVRPRRPSQAKRHMAFGVVWVVMGLFLIISTFANS